jgi:UDP-3-O-[3-hydroxymyristoyl] N-acetylglucosamine deacetylase
VQREVAARGVGLHSGAEVKVRLWACPGPVRLRAGGVEAQISELVVASTQRATTVEACGGGLRVGMVEHLFAALAGLGIREGVTIDVDGPEMPLLDGAAAAWCDALSELGIPSRPPRLRVAREAVLDVGDSRYEFSPADEVEVAVRLVLPDPRVLPHARWAGNADDFRARIAIARTFALASDVDELAQLGLARHVDPACVVVLARDAVHCSGRPYSADEPARHKLLDLIGDMYLHGGPPLGRVRAVRPGHRANLQAFRQAREDGAVVAV